MIQITDNLYDLIRRSNFCTIGYTASGERTMNEVLSKIGYSVKIIEYNNIESIIRDNKIDQIFDVDEKNLIIEFRFPDLPNPTVTRAKQLRESLVIIRKMFSNCKIVIPIQGYRLSTTMFREELLQVPSQLLYQSDLVISIDQDIKILKNRYMEV